MDSALVTAHKLGETKITGKCIVRNPSNDKDEVISEDTLEIHVVPLVNIQIKTPLVRIRSGAIMPAAIWGKCKERLNKYCYSFKDVLLQKECLICRL